MAVLLSEEPRVEPETVLPPVFGKETTHCAVLRVNLFLSKNV